MKLCEAPSPWDTVCTIPEGQHYDHLDANDRAWPNTAFIRGHDRHSSGITAGRKAAQIAAATRPATTARFTALRPPTEPTEGTAKAKTLALLRQSGDWVDGVTLSRHDVGSLNATRRIRELRADGFRIDHRRKPGDAHAYQYRLIERD